MHVDISTHTHIASINMQRRLGLTQYPSTGNTRISTKSNYHWKICCCRLEVRNWDNQGTHLKDRNLGWPPGPVVEFTHSSSVNWGSLVQIDPQRAKLGLPQTRAVPKFPVVANGTCQIAGHLPLCSGKKEISWLLFSWCLARIPSLPLFSI